MNAVGLGSYLALADTLDSQINFGINSKIKCSLVVTSQINFGINSKIKCSLVVTFHYHLTRDFPSFYLQDKTPTKNTCS